jgi:hypothetical protein
MNRIHGASFGPLTLKEDGIEYLCASPDKYPHVCARVSQTNSKGTDRKGSYPDPSRNWDAAYSDGNINTRGKDRPKASEDVRWQQLTITNRKNGPSRCICLFNLILLSSVVDIASWPQQMQLFDNAVKHVNRVSHRIRVCPIEPCEDMVTHCPKYSIFSGYDHGEKLMPRSIYY